MPSSLQPGAKYDLHISRGRPFYQGLVICSILEKPLDITGFFFKAQARLGATPEAPLLAEFTVTVPDPLTGEVVLSLTEEQTAALSLEGTRAYWDLYVEYPSTFNYNLLYGQVFLEDVVTVP